MPLDYSDDDLAPALGEAATSNIAKTYGIAPPAAVSAIKSAPLTGVAPGVGMNAPQDMQALADSRQQNNVLAGSPPTQAWVAAADPAHVAVAKNDNFQSFAKIAGAVGHYLSYVNGNPIEDFGNVGKAVDENMQADDKLLYSPNMLDKFKGLGKGLLDVAGALPTIALAPITEPMARAIAPLVTWTAPILPWEPSRQLNTPEEQLNEARNIVNLGFAGLGGKAGEEGFGAFRAAKDGGTPSGPTDFTPPESYTPPEKLLEGPKAQLPSPESMRAADSDATLAHVEAVQEAIADSPTHNLSPETTQNFLESQTGGKMVEVDADKLLELYHQGHEPFPEHAEDIINASYYGVPVEIPEAEYLAKTAGQPYATELNKATVFKEGGASANEVKDMAASPGDGTISEPPTEAPAANVPAPPEDYTPEEQEVAKNVAAKVTQSIDEVVQGLGIDKLFENAKALGMSKPQFELYGQKIDNYLAETKEKLYNSAYKKIRTQFNQEWKTAYENHFPQAMGEVMQSPVVQAQHALRYGAETDRELLTGNKLVEDGKPVTFYHGTRHVDIQQWTTGHGYSSHKVISFSYDPKFSSAWAGEYHEDPTYPNRAPVVYVTHIKAEHPADFRKPEDVDKAADWYDKNRDKMQGSLKNSEMSKDTLKQLLRAGNWQLWENPRMWKAVGFDAAHMVENEGSSSINISVADGKQIFFKYAHRSEKLHIKLHPDVKILYPQYTKYLPNVLFEKKAGLSADQAADLLGYPSGDSLLEDLAAFEIQRGKKNFNAFIKQLIDAKAHARTVGEVGDILSEDNLHAAALEAFNSPVIEDLLWDELKPLAEAIGRPLTKEDVRQVAEEGFDRLTLRKALNVKWFEKQVFTSGNKTEVPLLKDKAQVAFVLKQRQLIAHYQLGMAHDLAKEYKSATKEFKHLATKPVHSGMQQEARNFLRFILAGQNVPVKTGKFEGVVEALKGKTLETYFKERAAAGKPLVDATGELSVPPPEKMIDQKVAAFKALWDMVQSIGADGRAQMKVTKQGKAAELATVVDEIKANATKVGRQFTAGSLRDAREKLEGKTADVARYLGAHVTRPETVLYWLDGEENGPLMSYILGELQDGKFYKNDKIMEFSKKFNAFVKEQPKGWVESLEQKVDVPELIYSDSKWLKRRSQVLMMATHFGTQDNLTKLTKGFGWSEADVRAVADRVLTKADWDYIQFILDLHKELWPDVQSLYRDTVGLALKMVPAQPIETKFGTYPGGYRHITYDWDAVGEFRDENGDRVEVRDPSYLGTSELFGDNFHVATPPNKHTAARVKFSAPFNLEHTILSHELESVIHDLAFRRPLIQAAQIMAQPGVRQAFREALGPEYLKETTGWLQSIARQANYDQAHLKGMAALVRGFRRNLTVAQIGWNVATLAKHGGIAAFHIQGEVGLSEFGKAWGDLSGPEQKFWRDFVDSQSGEVRGALMTVDRDMRELIRMSLQKEGFVHQMKYQAFTMFGLVKQIEARATWLAKYRGGVNAELSPEDAIALANKAVRDTQGAGNIVDLPSLWRGEASGWAEVGKLLNMFTNFENTFTNRAWTMLRTVDGRLKGFRDAGKAGARRDFNYIMAGSLFYLVGPALFSTALDMATKGEKFSADGFITQVLGNLGKSALGGSIPGGTTLAAIPEMVKSKFHIVPTDPLMESIVAAVKTAVDVEHALTNQKVDDHWIEHAMLTLGVAAGAPTKPVAKGGQYLWNISHGKEASDGAAEFIRGLVFGPKKKEH